MLSRTSKRVQEVVDKMHLPVVVHLSRNFWDDSHNGTEKEKYQFVLSQIVVLTVRWIIITLELPHCGMEGQDAESLAEVLAHRPALEHLHLSGNSNFMYNVGIGDAGTESLAGVVEQCTTLTHLNLRDNNIETTGAERLAGSRPVPVEIPLDEEDPECAPCPCEGI